MTEPKAEPPKIPDKQVWVFFSFIQKHIYKSVLHLPYVIHIYMLYIVSLKFEHIDKQSKACSKQAELSSVTSITRI